jgi:hypothetical protein
MTPFHLTYTPGRAEFAAMLAARPTSRLAGIGFVVSIVVLGGAVGVLSEASPVIAAALAWSPPFGEIAVVGTIVLAWSGLVIWLGRRLRDFRAGRMARNATPVSLTMGDEGITIADGRAPATAEDDLVEPWAKVLAVTMTETHVVFAFADRPHLAIPLRAFAGRAEAAVFMLAAEDHLAREDAEADGAMAGAAS